MKAYQFPVKQPRAATRVRPPTGATRKERKVEPEIALPFGSKLEKWGFKALLQLGYKPDQIRTQANWFGGREWPGGQVIDIIVYKPYACAISFKGDFWHKDSGEELFDDARLMQEFDEYIVIWEHEVPDYGAMYQVMLERVGRP